MGLAMTRVALTLALLVAIPAVAQDPPAPRPDPRLEPWMKSQILDKAAIAEALLSLLNDRDAWGDASRNGLHGVRRHYTWKAHARRRREFATLVPAPNEA